MNTLFHPEINKSKPSALNWLRRWPEWVRCAAIVWTCVYGILGMYWSLEGPGYPLGLSNGPIAGGVSIASLCFLGVIVLCLYKFKVRGFMRILLSFYAWSAAAILCFFIPDARILIAVAYAPISLIGSLFGKSLHYFDFITWPVVHQLICLTGGFLWAAAALAFQRHSRDACKYCGGKNNSSSGRPTSTAMRWGRWVTLVAILAPAYYDITRIA
ncbi:hypothetical protein M1K46_03365 [Fictibacillus sp. WQ 8-8]|uniref:hypothetical protein n=1 Tax=Fictibacillus sp. WQ 8-8 TaxID=2938788 RepID=UPI00210B6029|nr:hypothetical protein [Fictibacillus sp. WQ 8-8]MCQ6264705.1 hypothetical protein [Fictibacillus sp. WQ 8-8]